MFFIAEVAFNVILKSGLYQFSKMAIVYRVLCINGQKIHLQFLKDVLFILERFASALSSRHKFTVGEI